MNNYDTAAILKLLHEGFFVYLKPDIFGGRDSIEVTTEKKNFCMGIELTLDNYLKEWK